MSRKKQYAKATTWALVAGCLFASTSSAAEASFFQGKTLTIVEARAPGGRGSLRVRAVMKYLQKYLGDVAVVYQYMPGGGGRAAANHLANVAKRNGFTIGNIGSGIFPSAIFGGPGVRYKLEDFVFLGSPTAGNARAVVIRPGLGLDTVEKLRAYKGLRFANRSVGHVTYISDRMVAFMLGLQDPKWILGYNQQEINLALERGEADAKTSTIPGFIRQTPHWLKEGFTVPIVVANAKGRGTEDFPEFPQDRPKLNQYADTELKRTVFRLYNAARPATGVFFASRGIPQAARQDLKEAFYKVWHDPQFRQEYNVLEPSNPITGNEIEQLLQQMPKDPKIIEIYKQIMGAGPLPFTR